MGILLKLFTLGKIQLKHTKKEEVSHFQIYLTFLKEPFIFIGQSQLPKCPQEKFEIKVFYYGDLAFFGAFLGDFTVNDATTLCARLMFHVEFNYKLKYD